MAGFTKCGGARGGSSYKKTFTKKRSSPDADDDAAPPRASKKTKSGDDDDESVPVVPELKTDDNGDVYVGLNASGKRRVTVSDFNKSTLVSIREYYVTDAGETRPGKKGISLTVDQYNALLASAPLIESALAKKDIQVVRPDYEADLSARTQDKKDGDEGEAEEDEEESAKKAAGEDDDDE
ncbi:hypothetical protein J4E85_004200 [Alternaria conjuncta]|uniref:uncharacterized protein n=1 Tax=Alternaria conjuncta TaxID=181017 RepID=UPI00221E86D3|nr:uncharacterized protein J4E85_004200 [Alternaria conjuncta]KAI4931606.1 hypothetical protein J4E85_004200 [Alternaria conjuncta]